MKDGTYHRFIHLSQQYAREERRMQNKNGWFSGETKIRARSRSFQKNEAVVRHTWLAFLERFASFMIIIIIE